MNTAQLKIALEESIKLQSHYAELLNEYDGGARLKFSNANEWIERLRATGRLRAPSDRLRGGGHAVKAATVRP